MAYNSKLGYDPDIDYSLAIKHSTDDAAIKQLQQERQKKINAKYGGTDPYKNWDSTSTWNPQTATADGNRAENMRQYGVSQLPQQTQIPASMQPQQAADLPGYSFGNASFEDFLAGTGYDQYAEATQAAIRAAVQNAVNGYRDQIDTTNQDSDELARQAYIAKMQGQKNLDQQMAANGFAGGMADSQRIATETNYQNQLNELEKQRQATVKELESAITNAQITGDMQTAQELASYLQQIQGQWVNYVQNQQQMAQQNYWNQKNMENDNYWNQQSLNAQNTENARSWAMQQLAKGIMPDDETLAVAGISKQAAQQQVALVLGEIGGGTMTRPTQQAVRRTPAGGGYNNGNLTTSQVKQLQQALGVKVDGMWGSNSRKAADNMSADEAWRMLNGLDQQIGMNRTSVGQAAAIQRAFEAGQISEPVANYFLKKFGLLGG